MRTFMSVSLRKANVNQKADFMLRTFIAVDVAPTRALRRLHARLVAAGERSQPVDLSNLHVTLKFVGDTPESLLAPIGAILRAVVEPRQKFSVRLAGVGAFPSATRPSVVWAGLDRAEPLCQIAAELEHRLAELEIAAEPRPFHPHLTLLRVKSRPSDALRSILNDELDADLGVAEISHVRFYRSELSRRGSKYTVLATAALAP